MLLKQNLINFGRENWKSTIRDKVCGHEKYRDMGPWRGAETADIVYDDVGPDFKLTKLLESLGYLRAGNSPVKYYLEVKTTKNGCGTRLFVSKSQYNRVGPRPYTQSRSQHAVDELRANMTPDKEHDVTRRPAGDRGIHHSTSLQPRQSQHGDAAVCGSCRYGGQWRIDLRAGVLYCCSCAKQAANATSSTSGGLGCRLIATAYQEYQVLRWVLHLFSLSKKQLKHECMDKMIKRGYCVHIALESDSIHSTQGDVDRTNTNERTS